MTSQKTALNIVMGAMTFGEEGKVGARVHDLKDVGAILDVFRAHGHDEVDAARTYSGGTCEEYLGNVEWQKRGLRIDTKLSPKDGISHSPEDLRKHLDISLKALKTDSVDMWYLHAPDRTVDYAVTLKAVNDLHKEGKFRRFGISNYMSWEVAEIVEICKANGFIRPTAYQGVYNAIHRLVEPELFPCLRKYGISFYEYNPLGGGFFSPRYSSLDDQVEPGSRFDPEKWQGQNYRRRYWNKPYFDALATLRGVSEKSGLSLQEMALRWITHHSLMKREFGDSVIIGASSLKHIEENLDNLEKGPLPEEIVKALDDAWLSVKGQAMNYFR